MAIMVCGKEYMVRKAKIRVYSDSPFSCGKPFCLKHYFI